MMGEGKEEHLARRSRLGEGHLKRTGGALADLLDGHAVAELDERESLARRHVKHALSRCVTNEAQKCKGERARVSTRGAA